MRWLAAGLLAGCLAVLGVLLATSMHAARPDMDRAEVRPYASQADREIWQAEWDARTRQWTRIPDPPGSGPVETAHYWLSYNVYGMELRRRGDRVVVGIHGIDRQVRGGGWAAFGEGTITARTGVHPFSGCRMRITWACLSSRYRYASDGVGYLEFSGDGREVVARYMAYEDPTYWARAHGAHPGG